MLRDINIQKDGLEPFHLIACLNRRRIFCFDDCFGILNLRDRTLEYKLRRHLDSLIDELTVANNWTGLVRLGLIFEHDSVAFEAAVSVVKKLPWNNRDKQSGLVTAISCLIGKPQSAQIEKLAEYSWDKSENSEVRAIQLAIADECGNSSSVAQYIEALHSLIFVESQDESSPELIAYLHQVSARTLSDCGDLEAERMQYQELVKAFRALADVHDIVYKPRLAHSLFRLGELNLKFLNLDYALADFREAEKLYRTLIDRQLEFEEDLAHTTNCMAIVTRHLKDYEASRKLCKEAEWQFRALARKSGEVNSPGIAIALHNLGNALVAMHDLDGALDAFSDAFEIRRRLSIANSFYTPDMAASLSGIGQVHSSNSEWDEAASAFREASVLLRAYVDSNMHDANGHLPSLALCLNNLGTALWKCNDLEGAFPILTESLQLYRELNGSSKKSDSPNLAMVLSNLANVRLGFNDFGDAIKLFRESVALYAELQDDTNVFAPELGHSNMHLGIALSHVGELDQAQCCLENAIEVFRNLCDRTEFPHTIWLANSLHNIGNMYFMKGELELAKDALKEALGIRTHLVDEFNGVHDSDLALTLLSLATVEANLSRFEQALELFTDSVNIFRRLANKKILTYGLDLSKALVGLGNLWTDMRQMTHAGDAFKEAFHTLLEIEKMCSERLFPDIAIAMTNCGAALIALDFKDEAEYLTKAAVDISDGLAEEQPEAYTELLGVTLTNYGNVLLAQGKFDEAENVLSDATAIKEELATDNPQKHSLCLAQTLLKLGAVKVQTGQRIKAKALFEKAVDLCVSDLDRRPMAGFLERIGSYESLGVFLLENYRLHGDVDDLQSAYEWLSIASRECESFRSLFRSTTLQNRMQELFSNVFDQLFEVCVEKYKLGNAEAAAECIKVAESSRARTLSNLLADENRLPNGTPLELTSEFVTARRTLRRTNQFLVESDFLSEAQSSAMRPETVREPTVGGRVDAIYHFGLATPQKNYLSEKAESIYGQYQNCLDRVRSYDPEFDPDYPIPPVSLHDVQFALPDGQTALVQFTITSECGYAFILLKERVISVELPNASNAKIFEIANKWFESYYSLRDSAPAQWNAILELCLDDVAKLILHPVLPFLPDAVNSLVLVPHRALHVFPLQACPVGEHDRLCDRYKVQFAPSLSILHKCFVRNREMPKRLTSIDIPSELAFRELELNQIEKRFVPNVNRIRSGSTVKDTVLESSNECNVWHYPGHCFFDPKMPLKSALLFGEQTEKDRWMTLNEVFGQLNLPNACLAVLSACESGMLKPDTLDELVGFQGAFLYAGAKCVVSSLWLVNDLSTMLLMDRFYDNWCSGQSIARALGNASDWLRGKPDHKGNCLSNGAALLEHISKGDFFKPTENSSFETHTRQHENCRRIAELRAKSSPDSPPFAEPVYWASFVATGIAWNKSLEKG